MADAIGMDLLYVVRAEYDELRREVACDWPTAKLEDASDFIHEGRFSVTWDNDGPAEAAWWKWLIEVGAAMCSLNCQMAMLDPKKQPALKELLASMKPEKAVTT
jgi:hypothetical protein